MKRLIATSFLVGALATTALAAPKPEWLPAQSDAVIVAHLEAEEDAKRTALWTEAFQKADPTLLADKKSYEEFKKGEPEVANLLAAVFGISPDGSKMTTTSACMGVSLPKKYMDDDAKELDLRAVLVIENPSVDLSAVDEAVRTVLKAKADKECSLSVAGDWRIFVLPKEDNPEEMKPPFIAYKKIPEGLLVTLAPTKSAAEAWLAGAKLTPASPLASAFAKCTRPNEWCLMVADISELIKRYVPDENARAEMTMQNGVSFLAMRDFFWQGGYREADLEMKLSLNMSDAATAAKFQQQLEFYRMMAAQMILPSLFQDPDSAVIKLFAQDLKLSTEGAYVLLSLRLSPHQAAKLAAEVKAMQEKQSAARAIDLSDDDDEEEDPDLTEEEARRIIDSIGD